MINFTEVMETNAMIEKENLDVRTITLGISLLDCIESDLQVLCRKIYEKITCTAKELVSTGRAIEKEFGIPVVNKRISVTPIALIGSAACKSAEDFVEIAKTLDAAAKAVDVNFIGGYSALVCKGMTTADRLLMESVPQFIQCRLDKDGHQYGCGADFGKNCKTDSGVHKGKRFLRLCKTCDFLQCAG